MCSYPSRFCPWFECENASNKAYPKAPSDMAPAATKPRHSVGKPVTICPKASGQSPDKESNLTTTWPWPVAAINHSPQRTPPRTPRAQNAGCLFCSVTHTTHPHTNGIQSAGPGAIDSQTYRAFVTRDLAFRSRFLPAVFFPATIENLDQGPGFLLFGRRTG